MRPCHRHAFYQASCVDCRRRREADEAQPSEAFSPTVYTPSAWDFSSSMPDSSSSSSSSTPDFSGGFDGGSSGGGGASGDF